MERVKFFPRTMLISFEKTNFPQGNTRQVTSMDRISRPAEKYKSLSVIDVSASVRIQPHKKNHNGRQTIVMLSTTGHTIRSTRS
jgi:hypothetical protein